jgi:1-deoxy-D-xylulose-5-phosphate synthase
MLESDGISAAHYDMRFAKPLDENLLRTIGQKFNTIVTVEDGCLQGGFGSAVLEWLNDNGFSTKVVRLGIPDRFVEHGTQQQLYKECGYDVDGIYQTAKSLVTNKVIDKTINF